MNGMGKNYNARQAQAMPKQTGGGLGRSKSPKNPTQGSNTTGTPYKEKTSNKKVEGDPKPSHDNAPQSGKGTLGVPPPFKGEGGPRGSENSWYPMPPHSTTAKGYGGRGKGSWNTPQYPTYGVGGQAYGGYGYNSYGWNGQNNFGKGYNQNNFGKGYEQNAKGKGKSKGKGKGGKAGIPPTTGPKGGDKGGGKGRVDLAPPSTTPCTQ